MDLELINLSYIELKSFDTLGYVVVHNMNIYQLHLSYPRNEQYCFTLLHVLHDKSVSDCSRLQDTPVIEQYQHHTDERLLFTPIIMYYC